MHRIMGLIDIFNDMGFYHISTGGFIGIQWICLNMSFLQTPRFLHGVSPANYLLTALGNRTLERSLQQQIS